jgi:hypothetical protein
MPNVPTKSILSSPIITSPRSPIILMPNVKIITSPRSPPVLIPNISTKSTLSSPLSSPRSPIVFMPNVTTKSTLSLPRSPIVFIPNVSTKSTLPSPIITSQRSPIISRSETRGSMSKSQQIISNDFIQPLSIHKEYGVIDIPGINVIDIVPSKRANKKYAITIEYKGTTKTIHYGNDDYQHYEDRTPLKTYANLNHYDDKRRRSYLARSSKITRGSEYAANDPFSANRYAMITLW